jgi:hypothetical protein
VNRFIDLLIAPTWPILLWSGLVASVAASFVLPRRVPRHAGIRSLPRWPMVLLLGVLLFAPLYGVGFEALGRANLGTGVMFGAAHGLFSLAFAIPRRREAGAFHLMRLVAGRLLYGTLIGFLYPVPPA